MSNLVSYYYYEDEPDENRPPSVDSQIANASSELDESYANSCNNNSSDMNSSFNKSNSNKRNLSDTSEDIRQVPKKRIKTKNSTTDDDDSPTRKPCDQPKTAKVYILAGFDLEYTDAGGRLLDITVHYLPVNSIADIAGPVRRSEASSGYAADASRTASWNSTSFIQPPPSAVNRESVWSTTTSSTAFNGRVPLISASTQQRLNSERIKELTRKWQHSNLLLKILDVVDRILYTDSVGHEIPLQYVPQSPPVEDIESKEPLLENADDELPIGSVVFARFSNKDFYPGTIISKMKHKWEIKFFSLEGTLHVDIQDIFLQPLHLLIGKTGTFQIKKLGAVPGLLVSCLVQRDTIKIKGITNEGDCVVPLSKVSFTEFQKNDIEYQINHMESLLAKQAEDQQRLKTDEAAAGPSGITRNLKSTSSQDSDESPKKEEPDVIAGCETEVLVHPFSDNCKVKLKCGKGTIPRKICDNDDEVVGPLIVGDWFAGCWFLLTSSERFMHVPHKEDLSTDNEGYLFSRVPFVYDRLNLQIKLAGGTVVDSISDVNVNELTDIYVIAPRPCLTPKYIESLIIGIQPVCHEWIVNCSKQKKFLPVQKLPLGWSLEQKRFITDHHEQVSEAFQHLNIQVASGSSSAFLKFWNKMLITLGAQTKPLEGSLWNTYVILVEPGCSNKHLEEAEKKGIQLVTPTWVIQSVLHNAPRPFRALPVYHPSYQGEEEKL